MVVCFMVFIGKKSLKLIKKPKAFFYNVETYYYLKTICFA